MNEGGISLNNGEPVLPLDGNNGINDGTGINNNNANQNGNSSTKNKRLGFAAGLIIVLLAIVGVVAIANVCISGVKQSAAKKRASEYAEYNSFLIPAAAIDITPFDDITSADMGELIEMSVWSVLNSNLDPAEFTYSGGKLVVPAAKVEAAYAMFFGAQVPISHRTVEGYGYEFAYDEAENAYYIPLTTITPIYTPSVTEVETKGNSATLTCGYINANMWVQNQQSGALEAPAPDKFMKITLREEGGQSFISAIRSSSSPEVAATEMVNTSSAVIELSTAPESTSAEADFTETTANNGENYGS